MIKKGEGIVIRTVDFAESNKIVTLFTRDFGKKAFMARGAKKPQSSFFSVTQLFTYGQYLFLSRRGMGVLHQGETIDSFRTLRKDIHRTAYGAYIVELLDKLTGDGDMNPFLFELLYQSLHYIDEEVDPQVISFIFETKMLKVAGIRPELDRCMLCKQTGGPFVFSITEGGLLCTRCQPPSRNFLNISETAVQLLRTFFHMDLARLGRVSLKPETKRELKRTLSAYYAEYGGVKLKSKRFLEQLERMDADLG